MYHILLVDDDEDDRLLLRIALEQQLKNGVIHEAQDGIQALQLLSKLPIDLVILDINMPCLSGFDVLDRIRAMPAQKALPAIMLSTSDEQMSVHKAYEKGANSFMKKPAVFAQYASIAQGIDICFCRSCPGMN